MTGLFCLPGFVKRMSHFYFMADACRQSCLCQACYEKKNIRY
jgi:hypothetical protein